MFQTDVVVFFRVTVLAISVLIAQSLYSLSYNWVWSGANCAYFLFYFKLRHMCVWPICMTQSLGEKMASTLVGPLIGYQ